MRSRLLLAQPERHPESGEVPSTVNAPHTGQLLLFLKRNQPKITLVPKRHILVTNCSLTALGCKSDQHVTELHTVGS